MRKPIALALFVLIPRCLAAETEVLVSKEQAVATAVKAARATTALGSFETEAKLMDGADPSWSRGWRDVDGASLAKWLEAIRKKHIWNVKVCPTTINPSGSAVRQYCIGSLVDAASGEILEGP